MENQNTTKKLITSKTDLFTNFVLTELNRLSEDCKDLQSFAENFREVGIANISNILIYFEDRNKIFSQYTNEIKEIIEEIIDTVGYANAYGLLGKNYDNTDPLLLDAENRYFLSVIAFEETANKIFEENGIEI